MTLKLALRNVRRSARDYGVYFITLALGVAMFYAFNSINEQAVLLEGLSTDSQRMLLLLTTFMGIFSAAVAFILAFLVVYANRFLLKRRKREFGMYLTLGMGPGMVSRILMVETAIVGAASLVVGIVLGMIVSQGLAFATAGLLGAVMANYHFVVSSQALVLTLACFAGVFLLSAVVNVVYISRRKLSQLITVHESNEKQIARNPVVSCVAFAASLIILALAYWFLIKNGMVEIDNDFAIATILMLVGTTLFFWSITGFVTVWMTRSKSLRYKGLATFTVRQITSKINTAFASVTVVCVMLFFAATTLAGGMGMVNLFVGNINNSTQYDATLNYSSLYGGLGKYYGDDAMGIDETQKGMQAEHPDQYANYVKNDGDIASAIQGKGDWSGFVKASAQMDFYATGVAYDSVYQSTEPAIDLGQYSNNSNMRNTTVTVVSIDQLNAVRGLTGKEPLKIADDEFLICNSVSAYDKIARQIVSKGAVLEFGGYKLTSAAFSDDTVFTTTAMVDTALDFVVPQHVIDGLKSQGGIPCASSLDIMYSCDRETGDKQLVELLRRSLPMPDGEYIGAGYSIDGWPVTSMVTAKEMIDQAMGLRFVITYLALYIGFILMLTTAAVLAIQQLSEVADSLPRYRRLATLGADYRKIMRSLRIQTLAYFLAPLLVATCHSACALYVLGSSLIAELGADMTGAVAAAFAIILVIYVAYLLVAYTASRNMVKNVLL